MEHLLLIDANSMVFRAYYATLYGQMMTTSTGQPTNALYGFAHMVFKAIELINPTAVVFAFDSKFKTFRHQQYPVYKGTRKELPQELIDQFELVRHYLDAYKVLRLEVEGFEADDIIGTLVAKFPSVDKTILTSDKDLLQLINPTTKVMLMKKGISETLVLDEATLIKQEGLTPKQIIDLKGLMGDASDNIPGIPKVGEKTAKKLLEEYHSVENLLEHAHELSGKLKENVLANKELALLSKKLATVFTNVPIELSLQDCAYQPDFDELGKFFRKYEIKSLVNYVQQVAATPTNLAEVKHVAFKQLKNPSFVMAVDVNKDEVSYHSKELLVSDGESVATVDLSNLTDDFKAWISNNQSKACFDYKGLLHLSKTYQFEIQSMQDDIWALAFLDDTTLTSLDKIKDKWGITVNKDGNHDQEFALMAVKQLPLLKDACKQKNLINLYQDIEMQVIYPLAEMEMVGIDVDETMLDEIADAAYEMITTLEKQILAYSDQPVNLNSPKQLATLLFDQLTLPAPKNRSTAIDVLESLLSAHPVIKLLIQYRKYQKFHSTYALGLKKYIKADGRIHTEFNQFMAVTGRLSSNNPNMQNISVRNEETAIIRKIFKAQPNSVLLSADYSQIELRLLAHLAHEESMISAFNSNMDIHTKTAADIFNVPLSEVTSTMRRQAKAVNFGIIYGISDYGLANQVGVTRAEANEFIKQYHQSFPKIKAYMDETVAFASEFGYVTTIFNRRREIKELQDKVYSVREFGKRAAMNAPLQGSAADLIKLAMIQVHQQLKQHNKKSQLVLQVHDELVLNVVVDELDWVKAMVINVMSEVVDLSVSLEVSVATGDNWYEAK